MRRALVYDWMWAVGLLVLWGPCCCCAATLDRCVSSSDCPLSLELHAMCTGSSLQHSAWDKHKSTWGDNVLPWGQCVNVWWLIKRLWCPLVEQTVYNTGTQMLKCWQTKALVQQLSLHKKSIKLKEHSNSADLQQGQWTIFPNFYSNYFAFQEVNKLPKAREGSNFLIADSFLPDDLRFCNKYQ